MAPKYPVTVGKPSLSQQLYADALFQVDADAEAARRLAEAASPKASGAVRIAGTNPNLLARLGGGLSKLGRGLYTVVNHPVVQGVGAYAIKTAAEGKPARQAVPEVVGGMGASALAQRVAPGPFKLPASITAYFLGDYLAGQAAGQIEPEVQTRTGLGMADLKEMRDNIRAQAAEEDVMYGTLPPSARVVTDYPEGIPTGVGGGNMGSYRPEREQGSTAALPGQSTTLSTPKTEGDDMQSELLKDAMTMRRAKEMAELGIYGGEQATTKGSKMYQWVHNHGDLADDLIRDKRMKEVRIARMFGRDLPTDAAGMDGQMGNFEAFEGMREMA
ncbi:MAG: hypothetical protein ACPGC4_06535 [Litorivicinaceae bacterium]